jgi:hypothetical protein
VGFFGGDFIIFRPKAEEILIFEYLLSLRIDLKFKMGFAQLSSIDKVLFTLGTIIWSC